MHFLVTVVDEDVALNNIKVFNGAMYMQQCVHKTLLHVHGTIKTLLNHRLFRIVITNNEC
jgi:hypothetical protein